MKIRGARNADIYDLLKYGKEFYQHTRYVKEGLDYAPKSVGELCGILINDPESGFILVLTDEDKVVGFILVAFSRFPFDTSVKIANELAYYIDADYRNGKNARHLLEAAETLCKMRGVKYLTMVSMETCDPRRAEKLYEELGYVRTETAYTKEL